MNAVATPDQDVATQTHNLWITLGGGPPWFQMAHENGWCNMPRCVAEREFRESCDGEQ